MFNQPNQRLCWGWLCLAAMTR